jgi:hypothetical protein
VAPEAGVTSQAPASAGCNAEKSAFILSNSSRVLYPLTLMAMAAAWSSSSSVTPCSLATARLQSVHGSQPPPSEAARNTKALVFPSRTSLSCVASKNS